VSRISGIVSVKKNPESYNRWAARFLPLNCRTGKIKRHYTWEKKIKNLIRASKIDFGTDENSIGCIAKEQEFVNIL